MQYEEKIRQKQLENAEKLKKEKEREKLIAQKREELRKEMELKSRLR